MGNRLVERLRANDKKGLFTRTQTAVSYRTGFAPLDYRNGYMVQVRDLDENLVGEYPSVGLVGGSFITCVGKTGTAKTTFAIQAASNIVKPFPSGMVEHFDLEQATNYTRIKNVNGFTQRQLNDHYILKQERTYIEDIQETIVETAYEKLNHKSDYTYDTGLKNEFNEPIIAFEPSVFILDSIPTMTSAESSDTMEGGTYANRVAKALSQFYKKLTPLIKACNINVIAVNHINHKIEINPMMKTQPQTLYMKMDESIPGGNAPLYYAHNLLKFVTEGKKVMEKDGYDGFRARVELIKSRTNKAGQVCHLAYDQDSGFDPVRTLYDFAEDHDLIDGRNPYRYFVGNKDVKFDSRTFNKEFLQNEQIRYALHNKTIPLLEKQLSKVDPRFKAEALNYVDLMDRIERSQEGEVFDEEKAS